MHTAATRQRTTGYYTFTLANPARADRAPAGDSLRRVRTIAFSCVLALIEAAKSLVLSLQKGSETTSTPSTSAASTSSRSMTERISRITSFGPKPPHVSPTSTTSLLGLLGDFTNIDVVRFFFYHLIENTSRSFSSASLFSLLMAFTVGLWKSRHSIPAS